MLKALVKIQFASLFAQTFNKTKKGKTLNSASKGKIVGYVLLLAFLFLYFGVLLGFLFGVLSFSTFGTEFDWAAPALACLICTAICFIGTVFSTQSIIFNSKDNDLLISMPIPPRTILLSRITTLAILNYAFSLVIFLPLAVSRNVVCGPGPESFAIIALFILVPLLSMSVTLVIGWLIALVTAKMKNKNIVTVILSVIAMGAYLLACTNLGNFTDTVAENPTVITDFFASNLGFFVFMGKVVSSFDLLSFIGVCAVCILPFAAVCALLSHSFYKIATASRGAKRRAYVKKEMKTSSARKALFRKETARLFSSPAYFMNSFMGAIFAIICAVIIAMNSETLSELLLSMPKGFLNGTPESLSALAVMMIILFVNSMNVPSAASISLEGKTLWILKSVPLTAKDVLTAKVYASAVSTAIPNIVLAVVCLIFLPTSPVCAAAVLITAVAATVFTSGVGIAINMLMPRFDWINETVCVKQSGSVIVSMLSMLGASLLLCFIGGFVTVTVGTAAGISVLLLLTVALAVLFGEILPRHFNERFKNLG